MSATWITIYNEEFPGRPELKITTKVCLADNYSATFYLIAKAPDEIRQSVKDYIEEMEDLMSEESDAHNDVWGANAKDLLFSIEDFSNDVLVELYDQFPTCEFILCEIDDNTGQSYQVKVEAVGETV